MGQMIQSLQKLYILCILIDVQNICCTQAVFFFYFSIGGVQNYLSLRAVFILVSYSSSEANQTTLCLSICHRRSRMSSEIKTFISFCLLMKSKWESFYPLPLCQESYYPYIASLSTILVKLMPRFSHATHMDVPASRVATLSHML